LVFAHTVRELLISVHGNNLDITVIKVSHGDFLIATFCRQGLRQEMLIDQVLLEFGQNVCNQ
jgi:hypothetical protein